MSEGKFPGCLREDPKRTVCVCFRSIELIIAVSGQNRVSTTTTPAAAFKKQKASVAVLEGRSLTDDVLTTTMCLLEHTLNATPLTSASEDPDDLEALTPNHFLLGRAK